MLGLTFTSFFLVPMLLIAFRFSWCGKVCAEASSLGTRLPYPSTPSKDQQHLKVASACEHPHIFMPVEFEIDNILQSK